MKADRKNEEIEIDLGEIFGVLLHYIWIIIISAVVLAMVGFAVSKFVMTPMYKSTTGIYIMPKQNNSASVTYSDTQLATQLTKDYEELIVCRTVLESVILECGLNDSYSSLKSRVSIVNTNNTRIIYITVTDASPQMAQKISDTIREIASKHITNVTDTEAVTVVDEANLPTTPSEPSVKKWTLLAAAVGVIFSSGIIIIRYLLDDTIKSAEDVENYLGLSTLALIPIMEVIDDDGRKVKKKNKKKSADTPVQPVAPVKRSSAPARNQATPAPSRVQAAQIGSGSADTEIRKQAPVRRVKKNVNVNDGLEEIEINDFE